MISWFFPKPVGKGSRFTLGFWGLGHVRSTLLLSSQPCATVGNRSRWGRYGRAYMGSAAKVVTFGGFKRRVTSFRVARVALCAIPASMFHNVSKVVLCNRRVLSHRFQKMACLFHGRRSTLETSIVILCGRRSTSDVSCCVFLANRIGRAASSGDNVQIPWQGWHFVTRAENWRAKHRFWGRTFSRSWENSSENADFEATKSESWRKSRKKCSFWGSNMSRLDSLVFSCRRRVDMG